MSVRTLLTRPGPTKIVGAVTLLVVAAAAWLLVIGPETSELSQTRDSVAETRDQNAVLAGQLAKLREQAEDLRETRSTARDLARKFPATADQPGLFEAVTEAAVGAGIGAKGVTTLAPSPPQLSAGEETSTAAGAGEAADETAPAGSGVLARQTVSVSVTGSYDQTRQLLENLEQMRRAYLVTSVSLAGDEGDSYTTTVLGEMFVMPPVQDPGVIDTADAAKAADD